MSVIQPEVARHHVEQFGNQLIFIIPSRKEWSLLMFLPIWLMFWAFAFTFEFSTMVEGGPFILIWGLVGLSSILSLLWMLLGKEVVKVDYDLFHIRRQIWGVGHTRSFDCASISNLRVVDRPRVRRGRASIGMIYRMDGPITFDYGAKTYRFGDGVEEAEARMIVTRIQQQFSRLS